MSKAKMEAARELIQEKKYDEARAILRTVDHPLATEWLGKIDDIKRGQPVAPKPNSRRETIRLLVLVALIALGIFAAIEIKSYMQASDARGKAMIDDIDYQTAYCNSYCGATGGGVACVDSCWKTPVSLLRRTATP